MGTGVNSPSSTILLLLRVDRVELAAAANSHELVVSQPRRRFSGVGIPWYHVERDDLRLRLNGVIAVADGERAHELADPAAGAWAELGRRWPFVADARRQPLARLSAMTKADLEALEYYAGAVELLDRLMTLAMSRPGTSARDIAACERWLHGRFTQYLTGRGALRNVVLPWRTWLERYEYLLRNIEGELDEMELPSKGPILELSHSLNVLTTRRDRKSIVREYRTRLEDLTDACNRVAAEIGVIGTFGSLALVPFESTLGFLFLAPVVVAGIAYYGGHSLARKSQWKAKRRAVRVGPARGRPAVADAQPERRGLREVLSRLVTQPVHVVASSRLSAADIACALEIRHQLVERTTCDDPLDAVTLGVDADTAGMRVVIGGPLVRTTPEPFVVPECDLTDSRGNGWEIVAGDQRIVHCDDDETVGCCAVGSDGRTLFVFGVRDAGTVIATRWLEKALDDLGLDRGANWVALRRGKDNRPEELARG